MKCPAVTAAQRPVRLRHFIHYDLSYRRQRQSASTHLADRIPIRVLIPHRECVMFERYILFNDERLAHGTHANSTILVSQVINTKITGDIGCAAVQSYIQWHRRDPVLRARAHASTRRTHISVAGDVGKQTTN